MLGRLHRALWAVLRTLAFPLRMMGSHEGIQAEEGHVMTQVYIGSLCSPFEENSL